MKIVHVNWSVMAAKRARFSATIEEIDELEEVLAGQPIPKKPTVSTNKHTLDSDEEDSDDYEKWSKQGPKETRQRFLFKLTWFSTSLFRDDIRGSDVEGEEESSTSGQQDEIKITPFNMREELQEGHFDRDGHYHWNKEVLVKDNWMDNIEWSKVCLNFLYVQSAKKLFILL